MTSSSPHEKVKVLLVDDRPENLQALEAVLGPLGAELFSAGSGEAALQLAREHDFAVALLDVKMPGMDGYETARRLRESERTRGVPVIFVTAAEIDPEEVTRGYALGAVDFLLKPFTPEVLRSKVTVYIGLFERTQSLQARLEAPAGPPEPSNVLVINDDLAGLLATEAILTSLGEPVRVLKANSGQEALRIILKQPLALILLDVHLPDMDGFEVAALLRRNPRYRHIPLIFVTATTRAEADITRGYTCGAIDFLFVPIAPELLRAKVRALLDQFRQPRLLAQRLETIEQLNQRLETTTRELAGINATLEQRVQERTAALVHSSEMLRLQGAALTAAANAIVLTDRDGTITWINPAFTRLTGYTATEAIGRNPRELVKSGQVEHAVFEQMWATILAGRVWHGELLNRRKDGSLYFEEQTITPLCDASGRVTDFIAIKQDLTERKLTEAQLEGERQRFKAVVEKSSEGVALVDRDNQIIYASPAVMRVLGRPAAEVVGRSAIAYVHPDDVAALQKSFAALLEVPGANAMQETRCQHQDGSWLWLEVCGTNLLDVPGVDAVVLNYRNITERKQAQATLAESEGRLSLALQASELGVWSWHIPTNTIFWSPECYRIMGVDRCDGTLAAFTRQVHPEDLPRIMHEMDETLAKRTPYSTEFRIVRPDGQVRWVTNTGRAEFEADGKPRRMLGTVQDITKRKQADLQLREQNAIITNAHEGVIAVGLDHRITLWNRGAETLLGWPATDALGRLPAEVLGPDDPGILEAQRLALEREGFWNGELPVQTRDSRSLVVDCHITLVRDEAGQPRAWLYFLVDVTEKKRLEEQYLQAQRQAEAAHQAHVAHLEKFHRLSVGREARVIELKQQINELSVAAGRPPPYALDFLHKPPAAPAEPEATETQKKSTP